MIFHGCTILLLEETHVGNDKVSITEFYVNNIDLKINVEHYIGTLSKGKSKDCLDLIDVWVELLVDTGVPL